MKYRITLFKPRKAFKKGIIVIVIGGKESIYPINTKERYFEFEVNVPWKYSGNITGESFDIYLKYTNGDKEQIVKPVPEELNDTSETS